MGDHLAYFANADVVGVFELAVVQQLASTSEGLGAFIMVALLSLICQAFDRTGERMLHIKQMDFYRFFGISKLFNKETHNPICIV
mgnify:CR=1 FL=1